MEDKLKKVITELSEFPFVKAIYLFGSSMRRKTPISDIDLCVLDDERSPMEEREKIYELSEHPFDISLFSDLSSYVRYKVLRGKPILVKDREFLVKVKYETLSVYFDMKPLWEEGLKVRRACGYKVPA